MIIVMRPDATEENIKAVISKAEENGFKVDKSVGIRRTVLGLVGDETRIQREQLLAMEGVENVLGVLPSYKLACRELHREDTIIEVGDARIGDNELTIIAGPCAVESEEQIIKIAKLVKDRGAKLVRGGAFKPRTSPYSFQGLGEEGLKYLAKARAETGLPIVTEVMESSEVELVAQYADVLQIGARNMQNFKLLKAVGKLDKPVLLKRGMSATLEEFLMCAEYIMYEGNHAVILCERGIRTFTDYTRNTLDLNIVPTLKKRTHLPVIVDPSHGTGDDELVIPMAKAAIAAGADGLTVEVHYKPEESISDSDQTLSPKQFSQLMEECAKIAKAVGRKL